MFAERAKITDLTKRYAPEVRKQTAAEIFELRKQHHNRLLEIDSQASELLGAVEKKRELLLEARQNCSSLSESLAVEREKFFLGFLDAQS